MTTRKCYWLDAPHERVMIGAWAVLIGRSPDCNLVIEEPTISRHHLLVRVGQQGVEMLPLGREPVRLNGADRSELTPLRPGDRIGVSRWEFTLGQGEVEDSAPPDGPAWCLESESGLLHLVTGPTFRLGGGVGDDLIIEGWEPSVLSLQPRADALVLTALRRGVRCGRALDEGERVALAPDERFAFGAEAFQVRARPACAGDVTAGAARPRHAVLVVLEFLPRGGQLTIEIGGRLYVSQLAERRCDMVACLLQPPGPLAPGDLVPEEMLCARIWPDGKGGRIELNTLLYRLRQNFADEGIDPALLFERRGGGLRFCLAPRARVVVR
jgi:hypothetical protein